MTQSAAETPNARMRAVARAGKGRFAMVAADDADVDRLLGTRAGDPWLVLALLPMAALAFRRGWLLLLAFAVFFPAPVDAFELADLWARRDQQAARAIEEGDTGRAATVAPDHRWRGAALYRGGRYDESAEAFAGGDAADDHYNRGNALARAGDLRGALNAWREALARDPGHEDAEHNRKIVESLLESQPADEGQGGGGRGGDGSANPQDAGGGARDRARPRAEEDLRAGGRGESGEGVSDPGDGSETGGGPEDRSGAGGGGHPGPAQVSEGSHAGRGSETGEADAEARGAGAASADRTQGGAGTETPLTEEQRLAYEQWLRRIPDDPGGLLRRKFALEYRARGHRPPARSDAW